MSKTGMTMAAPNQRFVNSPFNGCKEQTRELLEEIRNVVSNECGQFGIGYLFPVDANGEAQPWQIAASGIPTYSATYNRRVAPDPLIMNANGNNFDRVMDREKYIDLINKSNDRIDMMMQKSKSIISCRCSSAINVEFSQPPRPQHPYLWIMYIIETYGAGNATVQEKGSLFIKLIGEKMPENQIFNSWFISWSKLAKDAGMTEEHIAGLLLARKGDPANHLNVQPLPNRFSDVIRYCRTNASWKYEEICTYIRNSDNLTLQGAPHEKKSVQMVANNHMKCWNCRNEGHTSEECLLDACLHCKKFHAGHKWHDCPQRLCKGTSNKRSRIQDDQSDDEQDDEPSHTDHRGRSKSRGRNRGRGKDRSRSRGKNDRGTSSEDKKSKRSQRQVKASYCDTTDVTSPILGIPLSSFEESRPPTKRPVRIIKRICLADDDDDEYLDDDDDEDLDAVPTTIRVVKRANSVSKKTGVLVLDTGAEEWIFKKPLMLESVRPFNEPRTMLASASGEPLKIHSVGEFLDMTDRALVCDELDCEGLMSGPRLQEVGYSILLPAWRPGSDIGCIIYDDRDDDKSGLVVAVGNRKMEVDVASINKWSQRFNKPDICGIMAQLNKKVYNVRQLYGLDKKPIEEVVHFIQNCFHLPKGDLIFLSKAMDNFPVTAEQITKYYVQDIHYIKGHIQQRKVDYHQFLPKSKARPIITREDFVSGSEGVMESRNMTPGFEVGIDYYGPICNVSVLKAIDKATGYRMSIDMKHTTKKPNIEQNWLKDCKRNVVEHLKYIFREYERFGHHETKWGVPIKHLKADSDQIFRSKTVKAFCREEKVNIHFSPPDVHALNGLAEVDNKLTANQLTTLYSAAPWMPLMLFSWGWKFSDILLNLRPSRLPGSSNTAFEDFRNQRPNYRTLPILPWGCPVEVKTRIKARKEAGMDQGSQKFVEKSVTAAYLGPDMECEEYGAIVVWIFETRRHRTVYTYRVLDSVPESFFQFAKQSGHSDRGVVTDLAADGDEEDDDTEVADTSDVSIAPDVTSSVTIAYPERHVRFDLPPDSEGDQSVELNSTPELLIESLSPVESTDSEGESDDGASDSGESITTEGAAVPSEPEDTQPSPKAQSPYVRPRRHEPGATPWKNKSSEGGNGNEASKSKSKKKKSRNVRRVHSYHDFDFDLTGRNDEVSPMEATLRRVRSLLKWEPSKKDKYKAKRKEYIQRIYKAKWNRESGKARRKARKQHREDNPTLQQAMKREDWPKFEEAIRVELVQQGMDGEGVFDITKAVNYEDLPSDAHLIGSMFVLAVKRNPSTGEIEKYKARLVGFGNQQDETSYDKIKSSTARGSSVKLLIALQAKTNAHSMVLDVKGAFLKSKIEKPEEAKLYLRLPDGKIVLLRKYIYGLKQAGYQWMVNVTDALVKYGCKQTADPLVFTKQSGDDFIHMSIHVDDFYVISNKTELLDDLYTYLKKQYGEVTRKSGDVLEYLGISVCRDSCTGNIKISQPVYSDKIIEIMGVNKSKGERTPMAVVLPTAHDDNVAVDKTKYLEGVGLINYLATYTRPDLLFPLSRVAQECSKPTQKYYRAIQRIVRHIAHTKDYGITYKHDDDFRLIAHVDASYNQYPDGKGHQGYTISLGQNNGSFMAKSSKLKLVTLSSTESEYVALCNCAKEVVYLRRLLKDLGIPQTGPTTIYEDNSSAICQVNGEINHNVSKHIKPKYHFTRELIEKKLVKVVHKKTKSMIADVLTKPLPYDSHYKFALSLLNRKG